MLLDVSFLIIWCWLWKFSPFQHSEETRADLHGLFTVHSVFHIRKMVVMWL